jgi:hypothetical protein
MEEGLGVLQREVAALHEILGEAVGALAAQGETLHLLLRALTVSEPGSSPASNALAAGLARVADALMDQTAEFAALRRAMTDRVQSDATEIAGC